MNGRHLDSSNPFLLVLRLKDVRFFLLAEFFRELCGFLTLMIQDGGTMTPAWAPSEHGSSIWCSMKHVTLLWKACLHHEQLMAMISLLWKNFC